MTNMWGKVRAVVVVLWLAGSFGFPAVTRWNRGDKLVRIEARRFQFEPDTITLKNNETVTLRLSSGDVQHGLRIPALGVDVLIPAVTTAEVVITPHKHGTFVGLCNVYCGADHHMMSLTIEVRP